ncbi:hypothetical protein GCM10014715_71750 [Streptomyces spiralis]|uniref:Uncharacterized protein n=1 Tax=Streptomyces spiralis TaxID=66376 RepID=A0A919AGU8_9ACTN|nr:hypothetical protein GCM10014715_71750 [Streptomyces spiralis]
MGCGGGEGVGDDGQAGVGGDFEGVVVEVEIAGVGMVEALLSAAVVLDLVGVPALGEFLAVCGEFVDEIGEVGVVGSPGGFGAQAADRVVGDALPVAVEAPGARVEEDEAGQVRRLLLRVPPSCLSPLPRTGRRRRAPPGRTGTQRRRWQPPSSASS